MASPYGQTSSPRAQHSPAGDPRPSSQFDPGAGPSARPPRQGSNPAHRTSRQPEPIPRSTSTPLSDAPQTTRYRPPSQQILMADAYKSAGPAAGAYDDGYSEQGPPSEAEQDDFYAGQDEFGQAQYQREEDAASLAPTTLTGPVLDQSHLRPGKQAALLSHERTLELYRANAKKTQDPDLQFEFAVFMIDASKTLPIPTPTNANVMEVEKAQAKQADLVREATGLLKRLADRGHGAAQYFLADCYANGIGTGRGKQDFERAYPLFVLAAKHGHPDAAYRAGTCCENGWGCRREAAKALQFFRKAGAASHPGALYRLGIAELNGELGLSRRPKDGVQWLKRSAEHATPEFPHALHELALLHERGIDNVLFVDLEYAAELLAQAAELQYAPSAYRLGECYEYGKMGCPQDAALSIHYYNIAAQQNHRDACFALTAWYLVGSPGVLPQSDTEAYLWARRAAEQGLPKAMYAIGYFLEVGIGSAPDLKESIVWYKKAADLGDKRAMQRLKGGAPAPARSGAPGAIVARDSGNTDASAGKGGKDKDCIIM